MFSFDVFTEIMVVGALLLLSLTPIFIRFSSLAQRKEHFLPAVDYLKEGTGRLILAALVAYALGVAGNRLVDDFFDTIGIDPGAQYEQEYERWAEQDPQRPARLKYAEFLLRERSGATAAWLDRHKSFVRVLRGATAACALLLLTMSIYRLSRPPSPRYSLVHFLAAALLLLIFAVAHHQEAKKYKQRVHELSMNLPAVRLQGGLP